MKLRIHNKQSILFILFCVYLWTLFAFNTFNADYIGYKDHFDRIATAPMWNIFDVSAFENGFIILMKLCSLFINDYRFFLIVISSICILLFYKCVNYYSDNPFYVAIIYFIYPFFLDVVQIRTFLASLIIIYSIRFLKSKADYNVYKFIFLILLAGSIHTISYLSLFFLLSYIDNVKKLNIYCSILTIMLYIVLLNFEKITLLLPAEKSIYFTHQTGFIKLSFLWLLFSLLMAYACKKINVTNNEIANIIQKIFIISMVFAPFITLTNNFYRLYRIILLLFYCIVFSKNNSIIVKGNRLKLTSLVSKSILIICIIAYAAFEYGPYSSNYEDVLIAIFKSNSFWNH